MSHAPKPKPTPVLDLPPRPEPPDPSDCCACGCVDCVYTLYDQELEQWGAEVAEIKARAAAEAADSGPVEET